MDELLGGLDRLIIKKRDLKQSAMQQLLTGKTRLSEFVNKKGYKQTEIGLIPEDWDIDILSSVSSVPMQNGVFYKPSHKGTGVKLINVGNLYGQTPINHEELELFAANDDEKRRFRVESGDLFFTRSSVVPSGIAHCNIYLSSQDEEVVFDSHVIRVRPDEKKIDSGYLFRYCLSSVARKYLVSHAKTGTMTTIDQGVLGKCPVLLPLLIEQNAIASILSDMDTEIATLEQRRNKTRDLKQSMMQELLTGRIRLL
jgi:type I restriction enzyme, S subunit